MTKLLNENVQRRVARVYDIKNCGPNNRFVANGKLVHNSGGDKVNLQNLPRGGTIRRSICAPDGYSLVACDSSQIEARMSAWFAGQNDLVEQFANNEDVYCIFATDVFGRPITKADKTERHVGKTCILGLGYGAGGTVLNRTLATSFIPVKQTQEESKRIVSLYRTKYRNIALGWKQADEALHMMAQGYKSTIGVGIQLPVHDNRIYLPNGMNIYYNDLKYEMNPFTGKQGLVYYRRKLPKNIYGAKVVENVIQSLARIVVFEQMVDIDCWLRAKTAKDGIPRRVCLMVHDEVVVCVPEEEREETLAYMEKAMSITPKWAPGLPVACEGDFGKRYGDCK